MTFKEYLEQPGMESAISTFNTKAWGELCRYDFLILKALQTQTPPFRTYRDHHLYEVVLDYGPHSWLLRNNEQYYVLYLDILYAIESEDQARHVAAWCHTTPLTPPVDLLLRSRRSPRNLRHQPTEVSGGVEMYFVEYGREYQLYVRYRDCHFHSRGLDDLVYIYDMLVEADNIRRAN